MATLSGIMNSHSQLVSSAPFGFEDKAYDESLKMHFSASATSVKNVITAKVEGYNFAKDLLGRVEADPDYFKNFTTHDIAETLRRFNKCDLDQSNDIRTKVLLPLYKAYDPTSNHNFRAWDLGCRANLMRALIDLPVGNADQNKDGRFDKLISINQIISDVYDFEPATLEKVIRKPKKHADGTETLSNGSHDRLTHTIYINTYMPLDTQIKAGKIIPAFHRSIAEAASLTLHEARHSYQDSMAEDDPRGQEFRDIATIMNLSTYGHYYLNKPVVSNAMYRENPCEKDAYDFQRYMQVFLNSSTVNREKIIGIVERERDRHLAKNAPLQATYPQPALVMAA